MPEKVETDVAYTVKVAPWADLTWHWQVFSSEQLATLGGGQYPVESGFALTKEDAKKGAEQWLDALTDAEEYTYTPKEQTA